MEDFNLAHLGLVETRGVRLASHGIVSMDLQKKYAPKVMMLLMCVEAYVM